MEGQEFMCTVMPVRKDDSSDVVVMHSLSAMILLYTNYTQLKTLKNMAGEGNKITFMLYLHFRWYRRLTISALTFVLSLVQTGTVLIMKD
jgi:hypothetical protein